MRAQLTIVVLVALGPSKLWGQTAKDFIDPANGLTLEQALAQAIEREPGLRAAGSEVDASRALVRQAELKPNPTVSFAQQTEPAGTDSQTKLELQWPLDWSRKGARVAVAERETEAAQHALADRQRLLRGEVRMRFGEVLAAVRDLSVKDDLAESVASQVKLAAARAQEGSSAPLERDILRVELERLRADRTLQAGRAEQLRIDLKRLLGMSPDVPLLLREDLERLVGRELVAMPADSSSPERPDIALASARVRAFDARIEQARREGSFDVTLTGMYMRNDAAFPQRAFGEQNQLEQIRGVFHYWSGGVMVSLPLRNRNQGLIASTEAQRVGAMAQAESARLAAEAEIASARTRDERARSALSMYAGEIRALARQNVEVVRQAYELGRMTLSDVLNEQRRYLEIEGAYTSALLEAYESRQALKQALGDVQ